MTAHVDLQIACNATPPSAADFTTWVNAAVSKDVEVCIRIVSKAESHTLNRQYRQKDKPTNVLSFSYDDEVIFDEDENTPAHLGDLVICADIINEEALAQSKPVRAHWAHMVIHGTLHLQGFDHQTEADALAMESLEVALLEKLGFQNPYLTTP